jgi:hypothetical protein
MALYVKLNAEYATDDEFIEAGALPELLYIRALTFCKRKMIDGVVTRAQLPAVALGIPSATRHAASLVRVGLWLATDDGWSIVGWHKWNKPAAEIEAERQMASTLGVQGNHDRWHVGPEGKRSPKCPLCRAINASGTPIGFASGTPIGGASPEPEPEPEEKPEPEEEPELEPEQAAPGPVDNSKPRPANPAAAALEILIDHRMVTDTGITNVEGYRRSLAVKLREQWRGDLGAYLTRRPHATAAELAVYVLEVPGISATQSEPKRDWYADPHCPSCDGDGIANSAPEGTPATYGPCDCRRTEPYPLATVTQIHAKESA